MVLLHQRIAIGGFDAPQRQQRAALDAEILLDPREQRLVLLAALPCRSMMRQSEARRLMYCQICSWNSGCFCICRNTLMSGSMRPITRVQVASEMPFASARARKSSRHCVEAGRGGGKRREAAGEQGARAEAGLQQGAAGRGFEGIKLFHAGHSSGVAGLRQKP